MIGRLARWLSVWVAAFAMRRGVPAEEVLTAASRAFPHRDSAWRIQLVDEAQARNWRKMARR